MMNPDAQKDFFEIAYRTGSDVWTHIPYHTLAMRMLPQLPHDAFILDVGSGRGVWMGKLIANGYRVIGLDYIADVVRRGNADLKMQHMAERARFIHGDVLDIPIADQAFDAITDIGVLQHININDWNKYASELKRVVKPGGYVLNVSLSKETTRFLGFKPKTTDESQFEKFGVTYYFFTNTEVVDIFARAGFKLVQQQIEHFDAKTDPGDSIAMVFSLFQAL